MVKIQKIILSAGLNSLLGFAKKSHALVFGYEALRRGLEKYNIAFILLDESLAENSFKKIKNFARMYNIQIYVVQQGENSTLATFAGYKILGMRQGSLAKGFIDKLRQENQWL